MIELTMALRKRTAADPYDFDPSEFSLSEFLSLLDQNKSGLGIDIFDRFFAIAQHYSKTDPATKDLEIKKPAADSEKEEQKVPEKYVLVPPNEVNVPSTLRFELPADGEKYGRLLQGSEADIMAHLFNPRQPDPHFMDVFISVYRHFMTSHRVLDYVISHFRVVEAPLPAEILALPEPRPSTPKRQSMTRNSSKGELGFAPVEQLVSRPSSPLSPTGVAGAHPLAPRRDSRAGGGRLSISERDQRRKREIEEKERNVYFEKHIPIIRTNTIKFLLKWLKMAWTDFITDPTLLKRVEDFATEIGTGFKTESGEEENPYYSESIQLLETIRTQRFGSKSYAMSLSTKLKEARKLVNGAGNHEGSSNTEDPSKMFAESQAHFSRNPLVTKYRPNELAEILTLLDMEQFEKINVRSLLFMLVSNPDKLDMSYILRYQDHEHQGLFQYIKWLSNLNHWVTSSIFFASSTQERGKIIRRLIKTANFCRMLNNYSTAACIVAGIMREPVFRLTDSLRYVKKRQFALLQELSRVLEMDLTHGDGKFEQYHIEMQNATTPYLPLLPLLLRDLKDFLTRNQSLNFPPTEGDAKQKPKHVPFAYYADLYWEINKIADLRKENYRWFANLHKSMAAKSSGTPEKSGSQQSSMGSIASIPNSPRMSVSNFSVTSKQSSSSALIGPGNKLPLTPNSALYQGKLFFAKKKTPSFYFISSTDLEALESSGDVSYVRDRIIVAGGQFAFQEQELEFCANGYSIIRHSFTYGQLVKFIQSEHPNYRVVSGQGNVVESDSLNSSTNNSLNQSQNSRTMKHPAAPATAATT